jgi:hypothetical protein
VWVSLLPPLLSLVVLPVATQHLCWTHPWQRWASCRRPTTLPRLLPMLPLLLGPLSLLPALAALALLVLLLVVVLLVLLVVLVLVLVLVLQ